MAWVPNAATGADRFRVLDDDVQTLFAMLVASFRAVRKWQQGVTEKKTNPYT
jgi:hypothetical protein